MSFATKPGTIIKIQLLQGSNAKDYFESKERLFLDTILAKLQNKPSNSLDLSNEEISMIKNIFKKYEKFF